VVVGIVEAIVRRQEWVAAASAGVWEFQELIMALQLLSARRGQLEGALAAVRPASIPIRSSSVSKQYRQGVGRISVARCEW